MINIINYLEWFVIAILLLGALTNGLAGQRLSRRLQNWIACGAVGGALLAMLPLVFGQALEPGLVGRSRPLPWIMIWSGGAFIQGAFRLRIDGLSMLMAIMTLIAGLFIHLTAAKNLPEDDTRHLKLALYNGTLTALLMFEWADNLFVLLLGWSVMGWTAWALRRRDRSFPVPALLSELMLLLAIAFASQAFTSLSIDDMLSQSPLIGSTAPIEQVLPLLAILIIVCGLFRTAQFPFHPWLCEPDTVQGQDTWHYALTAIPAGLLLMARFYPLLTHVSFTAPLLSWWGATSALLMSLTALIQQDARRATRYIAIGQGGLVLLALGQESPVPALTFLPAFMLLQTMLFLAQENTPASPRWAIAFALAALVGFPLLPGYFFSAHLLALTFANVGLWIWTALTVLVLSAAVFRTIRLWRQVSDPPENTISNRPFVLLAAGGILLSIFSLTSPPLLSIFLEPTFGPPEHVPVIWFLVAIAIIGCGAWLGYGPASRTEIAFIRPLGHIMHTHRLRGEVARLVLAIGAWIDAWERRLCDWTWGRLARWILQAESESRETL